MGRQKYGRKKSFLSATKKEVWTCHEKWWVHQKISWVRQNKISVRQKLS